MVLRRSSGAAENAALASGEYRSALFERFTGVLSRIGPEAAVLDLGPTTPSNITFWTQRGHRVSAVGLAARLERGSGLDLGEIEYGGIVCWNVLTLLSRERARQVVADLRSVLVPGGAIFAIFDGDGRAEPPSLRYRITPGFRIDGMAAAASSQEIDGFFEGMKPRQLTVMRHGSCESVGQRPVDRRPRTAGFGEPWPK